jgi:hypothetical protein
MQCQNVKTWVSIHHVFVNAKYATSNSLLNESHWVGSERVDVTGMLQYFIRGTMRYTAGHIHWIR